MDEKISIISPIDDSLVAERTPATDKELTLVLQSAVNAQNAWSKTPIAEKATLCHQAIDNLVVNIDDIAEEITRQMGRPIRYSPGEIRGLEERGRFMIDIAEQALADIYINNNDTKRFIRRVPLGSVLTIAPWNYPYLTAVNSIIPALMASNTIILKHSAQTLLCAERFQQAFDQAGLPAGVFQYVHTDHAGTTALVKNKAVDFISFTGSVAGGVSIEQASAGLFKGLALELGGKDPAYVRKDADLEYTVDNLVEGAFFNSGQSCCAVERIYVDEFIYNSFVDKFIDTVYQYQLDDPLDPLTTLGPMVNRKAAQRVRDQITQACKAGAKACIDQRQFSANKDGTPYLAPQVLINVDHKMSIMQEESFGPVVGIMKVSSDQQAIELMNDSQYGLTASIWSKDMDKSEAIGNEINTGTVFMNRCDYLDPALAWNGINQSGRGCALSILGYQQLTRAKSFHLKKGA